MKLMNIHIVDPRCQLRLIRMRDAQGGSLSGLYDQSAWQLSSQKYVLRDLKKFKNMTILKKFEATRCK